MQTLDPANYVRAWSGDFPVKGKHGFHQAGVDGFILFESDLPSHNDAKRHPSIDAERD